MILPYKKDIEGGKKAWIEKVKPRKEAFFSFSDFKTIDQLPEELSYKNSKDLLIIFCVTSFGLLTWFGFYFVSLFESKANYNLTVVSTLTFIGLLLIWLFLVKVSIDNYKSSGTKLILTYDHFIYLGVKTNWNDVRAMYGYFEPMRSKPPFIHLKIRTKNRGTIIVHPDNVDISGEYLAGIFSIYKTKHDLKNSIKVNF